MNEVESKTTRSLQYKRNSIASSFSSSRMLYVVSSLIRPHMLSNKSVKILRAIPCYYEDVESNGVHFIYSSPQYYPLENNYFNQIDIDIFDAEWKLIKFKNENIPVYIMLHFKKN